MERDRNPSYEFIRITVMLATLVGLVVICGYFVIRAFGQGHGAGVRSAAGILLPLVVGGFVAVFKREAFDRLARLPVVPAFGLAAVFGAGVMLLIRHFERLQFAPIAELIVAAGLSVLFYAPGALPGFIRNEPGSDRWLSSYFGIVVGMLVYVVVMGFPFAESAR